MNGNGHNNSDPRATVSSPVQSVNVRDPFRARRNALLDTVEMIYADVQREADTHGANYVGSDVWVGTDGTVYA